MTMCQFPTSVVHLVEGIKPQFPIFTSLISAPLSPHINSHATSAYTLSFVHHNFSSTVRLTLNQLPWTHSVSTAYSCAPWSSLLFIKAMQLQLMENHFSTVCFHAHSHLVNKVVILSMSRYRTTIGSSIVIVAIGITYKSSCSPTM